MEIKPKFQFVEGSFDTQRVKLLCIPDDNHGRVDLCIKDPDCGWEYPYRPNKAIQPRFVPRLQRNTTRRYETRRRDRTSME